MNKQEALADLKKTVAEFMQQATEDAMERIDRLQASGADIVGDHLRAEGPLQVPRDFIAAFAEQMKYSYGWIMPPNKVRNKRIKNYFLMM